MTAVLGFLTALPELIKLVNSMWAYINRVSGNDAQGWIVKMGAAFDDLNAAKTEADHAAAAKALADLIAAGRPSGS